MVIRSLTMVKVSHDARHKIPATALRRLKDFIRLIFVMRSYSYS